jgi:hypothetical protein
LEPTADSNLSFFSLPGASAEILITKEVNTDNQIDMVIDDIRIEVQFDFFNTTGNQRELDVHVAGDLAPQIVVSQQDINGRQDGEGDFTRVFAPSSRVTLNAPPSYGRFVFDRWVVNGQEGLANVSALSINMTSNTQVEARFREATVTLAAPTLVPVAAPPGQVGFTFNTVSGSRYTVELSTSLANPQWSPVDLRVGNGGPMQFTRPTDQNSKAFFRLRVE